VGLTMVLPPVDRQATDKMKVKVMQMATVRVMQLVSFSTGSADILLLSDRYIREEFGDQLIGEVINNGTGRIIISYYDPTHSIIGTDYTYADPSDIPPVFHRLYS